MQDEPRPDELTKAVADFLRDKVASQVTGHTAFKLRVAINALDLVTRQLSLSDKSDTDEAASLKALLGHDGALFDLNSELAAGIASGKLSLDTPGLTQHLWQTTLAKLAVDQPSYASYRREIERK